MERQIVLPVRMKLDYSTSVTMKAGESPEAETNSLVDELVRLNSPVPSASDGMGANSEVGSYLALSEADHVSLRTYSTLYMYNKNMPFGALPPKGPRVGWEWPGPSNQQ